MALLQEIKVPLLSVNDTTLTVVEINVASGSAVASGDLLMVFETSKTTFELHAESAGFVKILAEANIDYEVNSTIAEIFSTLEEAKEVSTPQFAIVDNVTVMPGSNILTLPNPEFTGSAIFSNSAKKLLAELGADTAVFSGWDLVTKEDVEKNILPKNKQRQSPIPIDEVTKNNEILPTGIVSKPVSSNKKREIEYLSAVQHTGLISTVYIHLDTRNIFNYVNRQMKYLKNSLLPLIIYEGSRLLRTHRLLNAFYHQDKIHFYEAVNIGFAIDIDKGLKVLKVPGTDQQGIFDIEEQIFSLSEKYIEDKLTVQDLTDITFTVTDLSGEGIHSFKPLVNKYNSAILGISAADSRTKSLTLSLSFDHRVTEGKEVSIFLRELKQRLESYSYTDLENVRPDVTCYKCMRTLNEDLTGLGMIPCIAIDGREGHICASCWSGH